ncbi:acyl-CoA N-acyltransferase [Ramaria rubella]|nr:acyl-CoA N-acyltransferase [Ramaria rubella]
MDNPRLQDAEDILPILNSIEVYPWMGAGLPHPHELTHALKWLESVTIACDIGQEDLRAARLVQECPVRILREVIDDREVYLGDCGIGRWAFPDVIDREERERCQQDNKAKSPGDPTIIWSIGYYLKPSHHGKGIMKSAVRTLLDWGVTNMNVRQVRTTTMEGNEASTKVLQQNGFVVEKVLPEFASKAGVKVGLQVMEWRG